MGKNTVNIIEESALSWQRWAEGQCESLADRLNSSQRDPRFMMKLGPILKRYHNPSSCADHVLCNLMETVSGDGTPGWADPREVIRLAVDGNTSCRWKHKSCKIIIKGLEFRVYMTYSGWGAAIGIGLERPYPMKDGVGAETYARIIREMGENAALFEERAKEVALRYPYENFISARDKHASSHEKHNGTPRR